MRTYRVIVSGQTYEVQMDNPFADSVEVVVNGERYSVTVEEPRTLASAPPVPEPVRIADPPRPVVPAAKAPEPAPRPAATAASGGEAVVAPMPGKILAVSVAVGDRVNRGDEVCTLEAMKMAMVVRATATGTVSEIRVTPGQSVGHGETLLVIG